MPDLELNPEITDHLRLPIIDHEYIVISDDENEGENINEADDIEYLPVPALLVQPTTFKPKSNKRYNPIIGFIRGQTEVLVHQYIDRAEFIAWNYNSGNPSLLPGAELLDANQNVHFIIDEYSNNGNVKI